MYHHLIKLSFRYRNHTLISHNFLIRTYQLLLTCFHLPRSLDQTCCLANCLGHFGFKTLRSPTVVWLLLVAVSWNLPSRYARGPSIFFATDLRERNQENFAFRELRLSHEPTPQASSKKCIQALGTDDAALSAFTAEYEFHPHILRIEQRWLQERACHSTAAHPVRSVQEWSTREYFARNH